MRMTSRYRWGIGRLELPAQTFLHEQVRNRKARGRPPSADRAAPCRLLPDNSCAPFETASTTAILEQRRGTLVNDRADIIRRIARIASVSRLLLRTSLLNSSATASTTRMRFTAVYWPEFFVAPEPRVSAARRPPLRSADRCRPTRTALYPAVAAMCLPTHRSGECDKIRIRIRDHGIAHGRRIAGDDREHLGRQARFIK